MTLVTGYNVTVPNENNYPGDDQPIMLSNCLAIAQFVAIEHVPFNQTVSGYHNQVTFAANNVPSSFPITPPVLFTNFVGGGSLPQLFYYSGTAAQSANQYSTLSMAATFVSTFLFGGVILKCESAAVGSGPTIITYASGAFPNNTIQVIVSDAGLRSGNPNTRYTVGSFSSASFTITPPTGSSGGTCAFIAIGY